MNKDYQYKYLSRSLNFKKSSINVEWKYKYLLIIKRNDRVQAVVKEQTEIHLEANLPACLKKLIN